MRKIGVNQLHLTGYPRHTQKAYEGALKSGHKTVKTDNGGKIEAFKIKGNVEIFVREPNGQEIGFIVETN